MKGINQVVLVSNYGMIRISLDPSWPSGQPSYTNVDEVGDRYEHLQVDIRRMNWWWTLATKVGAMRFWNHNCWALSGSINQLVNPGLQSCRYPHPAPATTQRTCSGAISNQGFNSCESLYRADFRGVAVKHVDACMAQHPVSLPNSSTMLSCCGWESRESNFPNKRWPTKHDHLCNCALFGTYYYLG